MIRAAGEGGFTPPKPATADPLENRVVRVRIFQRLLAV
jgi:hypothetical protein